MKLRLEEVWTIITSKIQNLTEQIHCLHCLAKKKFARLEVKLLPKEIWKKILIITKILLIKI